MLNEPVFNLRPMRLVALLDAAFRLYRRHFLTLVGIIALLQIPMSLLSVIPNLLILPVGNTFAGDIPVTYWLGMGLSYVVLFVQYFLIGGVATLALTYAITAAFLGERVGIVDAYRRSWPFLMRFLLILLLAGLLIFGLFIWTLVPCVGWFSGPGLLLMISMVILPFSAPVVLLEKHAGLLDVLKRTWDLVRRRFWWVLGLAGVLYLLNLVLAGPAVLFAMGSVFASESFASELADSALLNTIVQSFISLLAVILYMPLQTGVVVLAYFDLRARTEGIDMFLNALADEGVKPDLVQIAEMPVVKHNEKLMTGTEIGYFVIITLVIVLLYVALVGLVFLGTMAAFL